MKSIILAYRSASFCFQILLTFPLDETRFDGVRGLIQLRGSTQCINKKSSLEKRYCVQAEQTDLLYANTKGLIQSGRV